MMCVKGQFICFSSPIWKLVRRKRQVTKISIDQQQFKSRNIHFLNLKMKSGVCLMLTQ